MWNKPNIRRAIQTSALVFDRALREAHVRWRLEGGGERVARTVSPGSVELEVFETRLRASLS